MSHFLYLFEISNDFQGIQVHCELMDILCVQQFVTGITQNLEWSFDNNLSGKTKWQNVLAQGAISCYLVSYRKSAALFV